MKIYSILVAMLLLGSNPLKAQNKPFSLKFNVGPGFATPKDDLGKVAEKKGGPQFFSSLESGVHLNFSKKGNFGIKLAAEIGKENTNFLSSDAQTELIVKVTSFKGRIYPFNTRGNFDDALEKVLPGGIPFPLDLPIWIGIYSALNSLHFDIGYGRANILETAFGSSNFQDERVYRNVSYTGWGLQPQIFQSQSGKWTFNAVFDSGKYKWENANKGTSSFKSSHLGFGVQYLF